MPRSVLITGGSRGIGLALAGRMAADGDLVAVAHRTGGPPKGASRGMLRAKKGYVVLISSAVSLRGESGQANCTASRAGLIGLARSAARELGLRGITFNVVAPGLTETAMSENLAEEQRKHLESQTPLGRLARPEEIAAAVAFLSSGDASCIAGAVLPADGGAGMGH